MNLFNIKKFIFPLILFLVLIQGCKNTEVFANKLDFLHILPDSQSKLPKKVAILPFKNLTGNKEAFDILRKSFYNHFSSLKYKDKELFEVDSDLAESNITIDQIYSVKSSEPKEEIYKRLGNILGVDGLIFAEITSFKKTFAIVYSQVAVGLSVRMVRVSDGKIIWKAEDIAKTHDGGVAIEPIGLAFGLVRASMNMKEIQLFRVSDDLSRMLVKTIPEPEVPIIVQTKKENKVEVQKKEEKNTDKKELPYKNEIIQENDKQNLPQNSIPSLQKGGRVDFARIENEEKKQNENFQKHKWHLPKKEDSYFKIASESMQVIEEKVIPADLTKEVVDREYIRGINYLGNRDYYKALKIFTDILPYRENDHELYFHVGFLNYQIHEMDLARTAIERAVLLKPDHANYHYYLGLLYNEIGSKDKAKKEWQIVLGIDPNNNNAKVLLETLNI